MPAPTTEPARRQLLRIDISLRTMLTVVGVIGAVWLVGQVWEILLTIVVALIMAGTLNPLVRSLENRGMRRSLAIGVVMLAVVAALAALMALTLPALINQVLELGQNAPSIQQRAATWLASHRITAPLADWVREIRFHSLSRNAARGAIAYTPKLIEPLGYAFTAIVLAIYLLADRDRARGWAYALVPRSYHLRLARIMGNLETIVGGYVRGQLITSALIGTFVFILLSVLRVPNALALAVFAAMTDVLPFIGALLVLLPCVLAAAARGPGVALAVFVILGSYQEFESRFIVPKIYGKVLRLPSATVVVAILIGGKLLGIIGALLALPIAAAISMILEEMRVSLPGDDTHDDALRDRDERAELVYAAATAGTDAEHAAVVAVAIAERIRTADAADAADPAEAAKVPITGGLTPEGAKVAAP